MHKLPLIVKLLITSYFIIVAFKKSQWTALVTGRCLITIMVLLCYGYLSGKLVWFVVRNCINEQLITRWANLY